MSRDIFFTSEIAEWNGNIDFYLADLDILKQRLLEVASQNTKPAIMESIEHFQNQFIVQKENLQTLKHNINAHKEKLVEEITAHNRIYNNDLVDTQHHLREAIQLSEKIFLELKHSFYRFAAKVL